MAEREMKATNKSKYPGLASRPQGSNDWITLRDPFLKRVEEELPRNFTGIVQIHETNKIDAGWNNQYEVIQDLYVENGEIAREATKDDIEKYGCSKKYMVAGHKIIDTEIYKKGAPVKNVEKADADNKSQVMGSDMETRKKEILPEQEIKKDDPQKNLEDNKTQPTVIKNDFEEKVDTPIVEEPIKDFHATWGPDLVNGSKEAIKENNLFGEFEKGVNDKFDTFTKDSQKKFEEFGKRANDSMNEFNRQGNESMNEFSRQGNEFMRGNISFDQVEKSLHNNNTFGDLGAKKVSGFSQSFSKAMDISRGIGMAQSALNVPKKAIDDAAKDIGRR